MRRIIFLGRSLAVVWRRVLAGLVVAGVLAGLPAVPLLARLFGATAGVASATWAPTDRVTGMGGRDCGSWCGR